MVLFIGEVGSRRKKNDYDWFLSHANQPALSTRSPQLLFAGRASPTPGVSMKRSKAFNDNFVFDDGSTPVVPVDEVPEEMMTTETGEEIAVPSKKCKQLSNLDMMIDKLKKEKTEFYQELNAETSQHKIAADILHEKNSSVKHKAVSTKPGDDFISVTSKSLGDDAPLSFQQMHLSRPILKGINAMGYATPTAIQSTCVPIGLQGRDICACSATGTGKTAAFMLPILERLQFKPAGAAVTRVLVVLPTRELALQVYEVSRGLCKFSRIQITLAAGGLDLKTQEDAVRRFPDILVATPGRLIDMLANTPSFHLHNIEILVLDEADRILDDSFEDQMKEIINQCSPNRQTLLFSATMTDSVKELALVSLKDPVKIFIDSSLEVAENLRQEFVRIRPNREGEREAILAALLIRNFPSRVIVFVQTKLLARRLHILLGLLGLSCGELHGNIPQVLRIDTLKRFKNGKIEVLIATDLAARGLDIAGVKTVVNFTLPGLHKQYIHRVGRTARAGKSGIAVSLVGEKERKLLKDILKHTRNSAKNRILANDAIDYYVKLLSKIEPDIETINNQDEADADIRKLEARIVKAEATLDEHEQLYGMTHKSGVVDQNQERKWFQTHKERMQKRLAGNLTKFAGAVKESQNPGSSLPAKKLTPAQKRREKIQKQKNDSEARIERELLKAQLVAARSQKREASGDHESKDRRKVSERRHTSGFDTNIEFDHSEEGKKRCKPRIR